jgi:hypothetical protein
MTRDPDRLYNLLPIVHRERDTQRGYPLRALLRVIAEQVDVVEADIEQLYENWFIETCQDWVVPYIGELIGYEPVHESGEPTDRGGSAKRAPVRILMPRQDVANTIRYRRRKGARALLELLANDVAGWPARVVEFNRLVSATQAINHARADEGLVAHLGAGDQLDLVDGPFERMAHTVDIRRMGSPRGGGRYALRSIGLFVWRRRVYAMTQSPAYLVEERSGDHCYTFSILGIDTRLHAHPVPEARATDVAQEANLPVPIRRRAFEERTRRKGEVQRRASAAYYGEDKSVALWTIGNPQTRELEIVPRERVIPADLTDWAYEPKPGFVALDPILGRVVFAPGYGPKLGLWVSYYYGFPSDIGGGEYERTLRAGFRPALAAPAGAPTGPVDEATESGEIEMRIPQFFRVGKKADTDFRTITEALAAAGGDEPPPAAARTNAARPSRRGRSAAAPEAAAPAQDAIIEIVDSEVYEEENLRIAVKADQRIEIRAASGKRPVIRRVDWHASRQDDLTVTLDRGSRFFLDGVLVSGRGLEIRGAGTHRPHAWEYKSKQGEAKPAEDDNPNGPAEPPSDRCDTRQVTIRHCTLVPGWTLGGDATPARPADPSLTLRNVQARVVIDHSIVGSIQVDEDADDAEPVRIAVADSIVDATAADREAIGAPGNRPAHAILRVERSTVIGTVTVHAIDLAENSIFDGHVLVARKQIGCLRFCYVTPDSRTPRRYRCQPETAVGTLTGEARAGVEGRVKPRFLSARYGSPDYCQLAGGCPDEIARGADDESEMGAYHELYQPQRTTNLRTRLTEYVPAGVDVDIIFAS